MCDYWSAFEPFETHVCNAFLTMLATRNLVPKKRKKTEILCDHKSPGSRTVRKIS